MATTYATAKAKILRDLDLEDEEFIQSAEMLAYFNDALRTAKQDVLGLYEDYFLSKAYLALTTGTSIYSLPTDIYIQKIRSIIYDNGSIYYKIRKVRGQDKFLIRSILKNTNPTDYYQYILYHPSIDTVQLELLPAAKETSSTNVTIFYDRDITPIVNTTDNVDGEIPGCLNYVYAIVKAKCKQKENAGSLPQDAAAEVAYEKDMFIGALTNRIPDDDNEAIKDFSFYNEIS